MSNYRLKTKGGCQTFLNPYLVPHIVFNLKLKKTINFDSKGQGNWFCIRAHVVVGTDRWMNCFECKEERGGWVFLYSLSKWGWTRPLIWLIWPVAWQLSQSQESEGGGKNKPLVSVKAQHAFPKKENNTKHNCMKSVSWSKASKPKHQFYFNGN